MTQQQKAKEVKQRNEKQWLDMDDVTAVGIGLVNDKPGIIISVSKYTDNIRRQIPYTIEGVSIDIQKTGEIRAQDSKNPKSSRRDP